MDRSTEDASKLARVKMQLEEKRRQMESDKRRTEIAHSQQQQQVGQAAFLQAINKV